MKNQDQWKPTKYAWHRGKLRSSRNPAYLSPGSRLFCDLMAEQYARTIDAHARGELLDLGCGRVPLYLVYGQKVDSITCIDWASSPHDVQHADILCDLSATLPIDSNRFDTVVFSDVLEHLYRPDLCLKEIGRVMRPGGVLLMNLPLLYGIHESPHDYFRYTRFAVQRMLEEAELQAEELTEIGSAPDVMCDLSAKLWLRCPVVGKTAAAATVGCWSMLRRVAPFRKIVNATLRHYPLGYFVVAKK